LDIRNNDGGDDGNDMELASYLIGEHFKENKFRKLNTIENMPPHPQYLADLWYEMLGVNQKKKAKIQDIFKEMALEEVEKGDDGAYYWKEDQVIHRDPAEYKFTGKTCVMTSGMVFSGGSLFSALVRDKSDVIFVGEETGGGYYRHTGTIPLFYQLPNSGFFFSIFTVINEQDVNQKLFPEGSGTVPHFTVYPTSEEFVENKDAVLEFAKAKLKEQENQFERIPKFKLMLETAKKFGQSLDNDNFMETKKLLSRECKYIIGEDVLNGPEDICRSYEQNMIEGRKKLDKLEWGQSSIEPINDFEFYVHFTDYLTHKGQNYTHKCKQKLTINKDGMIVLIEHINDSEEQSRLNDFYRNVGILK
jgi:peptidase S41-like protein